MPLMENSCFFCGSVLTTSGMLPVELSDVSLAAGAFSGCFCGGSGLTFGGASTTDFSVWGCSGFCSDLITEGTLSFSFRFFFSSSFFASFGLSFMFLTGSNSSGIFLSLSVYNRFISFVSFLHWSFTAGWVLSKAFLVCLTTIPSPYVLRNGGVTNSTLFISKLRHSVAASASDSERAFSSRSIKGQNTSSHLVNFICSSSMMVAFDFLPLRPGTYSSPNASAFSRAFFSLYAAAFSRRSWAFSSSVIFGFAGFLPGFFGAAATDFRIFLSPVSESVSAFKSSSESLSSSP
mmetsp:Transcript_29025/g.43891  ORF Transcript_29025/g.43891 Transcript_29025/m.43891 type:complete len:291 (-) Transcript_29025:2055-2927(-)